MSVDSGVSDAACLRLNGVTSGQVAPPLSPAARVPEGAGGAERGLSVDMAEWAIRCGSSFSSLF